MIRKLTNSEKNKLTRLINCTPTCPNQLGLPIDCIQSTCNKCINNALQYLRIVDDKDAYNDSSE